MATAGDFGRPNGLFILQRILQHAPYPIFFVPWSEGAKLDIVDRIRQGILLRLLTLFVFRARFALKAQAKCEVEEKPIPAVMVTPHVSDGFCGDAKAETWTCKSFKVL